MNERRRISYRDHASRARPGFTVVELAAVLGIILVLISLLLPTLQSAREHARQARCLANLRSISIASHAYASESPAELIIPIHQMMVKPLSSNNYWLHRTAMWFSYGGNSGVEPFLAGPTKSYLLSEEGDARYAAATRPLNRHLYPEGVGAGRLGGGRGELTTFSCPSDRGYPSSPDIDDSPPANADRPCNSTLGNSYRASLYGIFPLKNSVYSGAFALGPWGHRLSTLPDVGRLVLYGEPTFFNMVGLDNDQPAPDPVIAYGWHRKLMTDNVAFVDGSARVTSAAGHTYLDPLEVALEVFSDVGANWDLISRGSSWRFDTYPTPGARIWSLNPKDPMWNPPYSAQPNQRSCWWPFANAQNNLQK